MHPETLDWLQQLAQQAANALVAGVWQGLLVAGGMALCLRLTPRSSAAARFTLWGATFLVLALLPLAHLPHPGQSIGEAPASTPRLQLDARWSFAIAAVWVASSLFRACRLAHSGFKLRALWKNAAPVDTSALRHSLLINGLRPLRRGVQLCISEGLDRPSVIGFFSPRILIPSWLWEGLTPAELEQIVLHEGEHLRRGDDWFNLLQKAGLVLFPLNPVLVWIERRLCFERELACDDGVINATRSPRAYATCLTTLAERSLDRRAMALTLGAWEGRSTLARRVHRILL